MPVPAMVSMWCGGGGSGDGGGGVGTGGRSGRREWDPEKGRMGERDGMGWDGMGRDGLNAPRQCRTKQTQQDTNLQSLQFGSVHSGFFFNQSSPTSTLESERGHSLDIKYPVVWGCEREKKKKEKCQRIGMQQVDHWQGGTHTQLH